MSNKELELADSAMKHKKVSEMKTEERNELVSKLKQAAMGPRLAALQIQLLDQMIAGLKKRRKDVAQQISDDLARIAWIEAEEASLHASYDPLASLIDRKNKDKDTISKNLNKHGSELRELGELVHNTMKRVVKTTEKINKNIASRDLERLRGFSTKFTDNGKRRRQPSKS